LICWANPGEATHWTGRAMAKAFGVSPHSIRRLWDAHRKQACMMRRRSGFAQVCQSLPPRHEHIDLFGIELNEANPAPGVLAGDHRGPGASKEIQHVVSAFLRNCESRSR